MIDGSFFMIFQQMKYNHYTSLQINLSSFILIDEFIRRLVNEPRATERALWSVLTSFCILWQVSPKG